MPCLPTKDLTTAGHPAAFSDATKQLQRLRIGYHRMLHKLFLIIRTLFIPLFAPETSVYTFKSFLTTGSAQMQI
jgi:hypothetical protein